MSEKNIIKKELLNLIKIFKEKFFKADFTILEREIIDTGKEIKYSVNSRKKT